ncbi:MAG: hypothetical protein K5864_04485 [Bacteroidales bacterium]|nr:hypothetical protein [Bacteroidales bacterium]
MKKTLHYIFIALMTMALASCDKFEGDQEEPSFLHIEAIDLVDNPSDSWSPESGFFTYQIDAAQIVLYQEGDDSETILGTFTLPCTVPVLKKGNITSITVTPVIKQNGIASTRISYPFYKAITLNDIPLQIDSLTDLGHLQTQYISRNSMRVVWSEFFEPGPGDLTLDSVVRRLVYITDTVRSGYGCGVVRVNDSTTTVSFWTDTTYHVDINSESYLYLEMDYWSDFDFSVGFNNPTMVGTNNVIKSAMTLYANKDKGWQKIYINMGKLWKWYHFYPDLRFYFTILNNPPHEGSLYIDNIKLLAM